MALSIIHCVMRDCLFGPMPSLVPEVIFASLAQEFGAWIGGRTNINMQNDVVELPRVLSVDGD